jgi:hypothetical protein
MVEICFAGLEVVSGASLGHNSEQGIFRITLDKKLGISGISLVIQVSEVLDSGPSAITQFNVHNEIHGIPYEKLLPIILKLKNVS